MTPETASHILKVSGTRLMDGTGMPGGTPGTPVIGIWSDLDCEIIRGALETFGNAECTVVYLDGPGVASRYKLRTVTGDPVPINILEAMAADTRAGRAPWRVRERMLAEMRWHKRPVPFPA